MEKFWKPSVHTTGAADVAACSRIVLPAIICEPEGPILGHRDKRVGLFGSGKGPLGAVNPQ